MKQIPTIKSHIMKKTIKALTRINKVLTNLGSAAASAIRN